MNWKLSNEFFSRICNLTFMLSFHHRRVATQVTNQRILYNKLDGNKVNSELVRTPLLDRCLLAAHLCSCVQMFCMSSIICAVKTKFWKLSELKKSFQRHVCSCWDVHICFIELTVKFLQNTYSDIKKSFQTQLLRFD